MLSHGQILRIILPKLLIYGEEYQGPNALKFLIVLTRLAIYNYR